MWLQHYTPVWGNLALSALAAALPLALVLGLFLSRRVTAHTAALIGLTATLAIASGIYGMPLHLVLSASAFGFLYGLFPIGWIVISALFVYDVAVQTGTFETVKQSVSTITGDRRIQVLLIAFCFGAFIEGAAGFGTPVAISTAMLIGLGIPALKASRLTLLGNTVPVAFAALGTPVVALASVTGLSILSLSATIGRELFLFAIVIPFFLLWTLAGWKQMLEVWPACLTAGGSFALTQLLISNISGPWIVGLASGIVSLLSVLYLLRFWTPVHSPSSPSLHLSLSKQLRAWLPWALLSLFVFLWGIPQVKMLLETFEGKRFVSLPIPWLHQGVLRNVPLVAAPRPENALFLLNWLSSAGTSLFFSGIASGLLLGVRPRTLLKIFAGTFRRIYRSLLAIALMLAFAFTIRYAGMDATLGLVFAGTGMFFPFFSPLLGWLGVAITGSDTTSNVLFGNMQQVTAQALGISPLLAAASHSAGGVIGKMVSTQSIVVACAATNSQGEEGRILRSVLLPSILLVVVMGILVMLLAYAVPWMIPQN
ncbi:MAG: L-lactate permease [Ignavibacteriales bacterium]|nr:L-lactate permease [Ignavibacteriales bacterium]